MMHKLLKQLTRDGQEGDGPLIVRIMFWSNFGNQNNICTFPGAWEDSHINRQVENKIEFDRKGFKHVFQHKEIKRSMADDFWMSIESITSRVSSTVILDNFKLDMKLANVMSNGVEGKAAGEDGPAGKRLTWSILFTIGLMRKQMFYVFTSIWPRPSILLASVYCCPICIDWVLRENPCTCSRATRRIEHESLT